MSMGIGLGGISLLLLFLTYAAVRCNKLYLSYRGLYTMSYVIISIKKRLITQVMSVMCLSLVLAGCVPAQQNVAQTGGQTSSNSEKSDISVDVLAEAIAKALQKIKPDNSPVTPAPVEQKESLQTTPRPVPVAKSVVPPAPRVLDKDKIADSSRIEAHSDDVGSYNIDNVLAVGMSNSDEGYASNGRAATADVGFQEVSSLSSQRELVAANTNANNKNIHVALLLPLSGASAKIGQSMLDAAQMALFDIARKNKNRKIILLPFDTRGNANEARQAAEKALARNPDIVIGPVFSQTSKAAASVFGPSKTPIISLSNDSALTSKGVFVFGFGPEQHIKRVLDYAVTQKMEQFTMLVPDNRLGRSVVDQAEEVLSKRELPLQEPYWYKKADKNLSQNIKHLAYLPEDARAGIGFQSEGLLIPEGGTIARTIASRLEKQGSHAQRFRLLGSGEWDDVSLAQDPNLLGAWFATSAPEARELFDKRFNETYGYMPLRTSSLSYDALALVITLVNAIGGTDVFSHDNLTNVNGFAGVNGVFRFTEDGITERALAVMEMTEFGPAVIDPAASSF